jgi:beta-N-acetylhexosaminidase
MIDLKIAPFFLSDADIDWLTTTLNQMTLEEKVGQLFMPVGLSSDKAVLRETIDKFKPAGMMFRPGLAKEVQDIHRFLQHSSSTPLLLASNLESGGNGSAVDGTEFGCLMQIAASDDLEQVKQLARVSAREGKAMGVNWTFAPVVDIDINPHNPITNVRTFGSDTETVASYSATYIREMAALGMATAAKHFPGDGVDGRDQHITTTHNTLSIEQWDRSYGKVYQEVIKANTLSIMAGHIGLPSYSQYYNPQLRTEDVLPASLSKELLQHLLREKLGFNGVIVTDATAMVGFTTAMPRAQAVPQAIAAGCDIFLFNKDLEEDFDFMLDGIHRGTLSIDRVNEAVTRTLAMKASLGLHRVDKASLVPDESALDVVGSQSHRAMSAECAQRSITLVKDDAPFLPINQEKSKRVLLLTLTDDGDFFGKKNNVFDCAVVRLKEEGFEIDLFDPSKFTMRDTKLSVGQITDKYDFALYLANIKPASNKTSLRLTWTRPMGIDAPWFSAELPTIFVSFGNPYHLYDVPSVGTYINAYTATPQTIDAVIDKLIGRSSFVGTSPVDPWLPMRIPRG